MTTFELSVICVLAVFFAAVIYRILKKPIIIKETNPIIPETPKESSGGCKCYSIMNDSQDSLYFEFIGCIKGYSMEIIGPGETKRVCSSNYPSGVGLVINPCSSTTDCSSSDDCNDCI